MSKPKKQMPQQKINSTAEVKGFLHSAKAIFMFYYWPPAIGILKLAAVVFVLQYFMQVITQADIGFPLKIFAAALAIIAGLIFVLGSFFWILSFFIKDKPVIKTKNETTRP